MSASNHATTTPASTGPTLARAAQVAWVACAIGLLAGAAFAAIEIVQYDDPAGVALPILTTEIARGISLATIVVVGSLAIFVALHRLVPHPLWRARVAAFVPWLFAQIELVAFANAVVLPGLPTWQRALIHASFAIGLLAATETAARLLRAWHARALEPGRRPPLTPTALLVIGVVALGVADHRARIIGERPHVIVILIDVLRADHLGSYGNTRDASPHLDRFAEDAVVFEQAISQSSFTKTSISSLFSSLYPYGHGVYQGSLADTASNITSDVLPASLTTMAEAFRGAGYLTGAWVKNEQLRAYMGFDQGFDLYRDQPGPATRIAEEFARWHKRWGTRRPFYAYLHVLELHGPYRPDPPFDTQFGTYSDTVTGMTTADWRSYRKAVARGELIPEPADVEQLKALYDGDLAFIDSVMGGVFDELKRDGLYDDALIVVTGDHGDAFMEHGFLAHSNTPYEELIHVPLIVKLPGARHAGRRIQEPVALVDVAPTLLDLVGAPPIEDIDGISQLPLIEDSADEPARRTIVSEFEECIAVRSGPWKYLACPDEGPALFDLDNDPGERTNLIEARPDVATRLTERAERARAERRAPGERVIVDPETVDELEALGYL